MKKLFFGLMAVVSVVCLTLAVSSCGNDDDDDTEKVEVSWEVNYYGDSNLPDEVKKERDAVVKQIDERAMEIFGKTFKLEAAKGSIGPSSEAKRASYDRFEKDGKISSCLNQMREINKKYGKNYITEVEFCIYYGDYLVGSNTIRTSVEFKAVQ